MKRWRAKPHVTNDQRKSLQRYAPALLREKEILEQFLLHNNNHPEHLAEDGDHLSNEGIQIYK